MARDEWGVCNFNQETLQGLHEIRVMTGMRTFSYTLSKRVKLLTTGSGLPRAWTWAQLGRDPYLDLIWTLRSADSDARLLSDPDTPKKEDFQQDRASNSLIDEFFFTKRGVSGSSSFMKTMESSRIDGRHARRNFYSQKQWRAEIAENWNVFELHILSSATWLLALPT